MATEVKVSSIPDCDVCKFEKPGEKPKPATVDGKAVHGPWAYMCDEHWESHGVGKLGTGFGQRLMLES